MQRKCFYCACGYEQLVDAEGYLYHELLTSRDPSETETWTRVRCTGKWLPRGT
jgi:hypothetical protein